MGKNWEHYSHTADMGIRGFGNSPAEAFEAAALAMIAISVDPGKIKQKQKVEVVCKEQENELLLIAWLNGIIYEMATRKMLFSRFEVSIKDNRLTGRAWGEKLNLKRHKPVVEIKGTTYSDLKVMKKKTKWIAQCIVDI